MSLYSTGVRVVETVEIPYGTEGESLKISVPRKKERKDLWTGLPDEVKVGVLRWLEPKELVRCSAVSLYFYTCVWTLLTISGL